MRLIDVNMATQSIKNLIANGATVEQALDAQPTAYEVDKVVEQLEIMAAEAKDIERYQDGYEDGINDAIEIVKEGGVNE